MESLLEHKRIGMIAFPTMLGARVGSALEQVGAWVAHIDAHTVSPGDPELERYDALVLYVSDGAAELDWFRPEILRLNTRPLLLASPPEPVQRRVCLQSYVDDVIFRPFLTNELVLRLHRLIAATGERRRAVAQSDKPCVLVADDDPDIGIYLKNVFRNFNVDSHFVSDGGAALAAARELLPDLLILDVGMPVMNGIDVLRALKKDPGTSTLVTVLLTGSSDPLHVEVCAALGAVDYILKPLSHIDVTRKVKALLTRQVGLPGTDPVAGDFGRTLGGWPGYAPRVIRPS